MRLTAKERILIHLLEFQRFSDMLEVPVGMGQNGIALAIGIRVPHIRQFVGPLIKESLLRERVAHVKGHRRRLRIYDLTNPGRLAAIRLREKVLVEPIRIRVADGIRETTVEGALKEAAGRATLSVILRDAMDDQVVDLESLSAANPASPHEFVTRLAEAPRLRAFVGRQDELEALTMEGDGPKVFVVRGVAGIGKSSLAARACEQLRGSRHLYWHRVRPWDTRLSILASIADFLTALGRPGLRAVLARGEPDKADQVLRQDLSGSRSMLVFDDAHEGNREVVGFLAFLKDVISETPDLRAIILSRRAIAAYDRRDVTIRGLVREFDLEGLDAAEIESLLGSEPGGAHLREAARQLGGHPLFLELLRSSSEKDPSVRSLKDVRRFVEEEIYVDLTDAERRMMKTAALYAVPFPRQAVWADEKLSHDVFLSLATKSLIRPIGDDDFGVHDTIRDFFTSILTPSEREILTTFVVEQLRRLAAAGEARKDFVAALNCLSNALDLTDSKAQQAPLCEALGDTHELIGDLEAALIAYVEASQRTTEPEFVARLHRKTAAALQVRGETTRAVAEVEAGFEALGERQSVERGWLSLVQCRVALGREEWREAREHGDSALATFLANGNEVGQALTLLDLAYAESNAPQGDSATAEHFLQSALELSKSIGDSEFQARVHIALAYHYAYVIGDIGHASHHVEAAETLQNSISDPHVRRLFVFLLAWFTLYERAEFREAESLFTEAQALSERIHDSLSLAFAKYGLAHVAYFEDRIDEARKAFEACAFEIESKGHHGYAMECRWMIAECCMRLADLDGFLRVAAESRDPQHSAEVAARPGHAKVLRGLECLLGGDRAGCEGAFAEAFRLLDTQSLPQDILVQGLVHFFCGIGLRAAGLERQGREHVLKSQKLFERSGMTAQLSLTRQAEDQLVRFLRQAQASYDLP